MDWGAIEADILHVQNLMKDSKFSESVEVLKKCMVAVQNTNELRTNRDIAKQCLIIHMAMTFLYKQKFIESLNCFEQVSARHIYGNKSEMSSLDGSGVERVLELSREYLLHSYMNASVAAEKCDNAHLTQCYLEKAIQLYREEGLVKYEAVTWHRLGMLLDKVGKHTQAGLSLNTAALLFKKCEESVLEAESLCDLASLYWRTGNTSRVSETMERTHFICLGLIHKPEDQKNLYHRLSDLYTDQQAHSDAEVCMDHVLASSKTGLERARAVMRRAKLLKSTHDRERWERAMREAREECELAVVEYPKEASKIFIGIAEGWSDKGQFEESENILQRLIEHSRGSDRLVLILSEALERLGDLLIKQRRDKEAEIRYKEAYLVLELKYNEYGDEEIGARLQSVWNKHKSLLTGEQAATDYPSLIGNSCINQTEAELHSLVTVSDLSELSCNDATITTRSLIKQEDDTDIQLCSSITAGQLTVTPINLRERNKKFSTGNRFRKNRISPVESVTSQSSSGNSDDVGLGKNLTDNINNNIPSSRACVVL
ncbi:hypothetical protein LOD99_12830 [Oopsacas minuta]|uniref:Uncharacterized protein n=1 Tax=Oopsacas minuta TaxID=111878 RepID=A0AAV7JD34_9METZ|nr:hypothetical protein LOD99_12830 [Oopsacas minuta]